jgi:hypothetical protein
VCAMPATVVLRASSRSVLLAPILWEGMATKRGVIAPGGVLVTIRLVYASALWAFLVPNAPISLRWCEDYWSLPRLCRWEWLCLVCISAAW